MTPALPELASYLDSLSEPHILLDERYRILSANSAYRRQFGTQTSVIGRTCYEVSHHFGAPCDQSGESCPMAQARQSGQRERVLHLHHTPKGEAYVNIELVPLTDASGTQRYFIEKMEEVQVAKGLPTSQGLVGRSAAFRNMLALTTRVGPSMAAVLLLGESGTGKELAARAVHAASQRAHAPLVVVECASLTESLFESELFGHEKGAFTGAHSSRGGLVEAASGGTLFLDEVGDIPMAMQVKLLRLLESGTYRRVGSTELRRSDVRIISATHRDLASLMTQGLFREDLYYRLSTFPIRMPALRERREDIPLLAQALLSRVSPERALSLSKSALACLIEYPFPGNIRELRNVLERAALLCDGHVIDQHHLTFALHGATSGATLPAPSYASLPQAPSGHALPGQSPATMEPPGGQSGTIGDMTQALLQHHLATHQGSRAELAAKLGMSTRSLYRKLKALPR